MPFPQLAFTRLIIPCRAGIFLLIPVYLALASCTSNTSTPPEPVVPVVKETKIGLASFYSQSFQGDKTANGEIFDNNQMVAAHPGYPFGTIVRVTNTRNGRAVEVRIVDRGPTRKNQAKGVLIDLSRAAAKKLGMVKQGRVRVKIEVLEWGREE